MNFNILWIVLLYSTTVLGQSRLINSSYRRRLQYSNPRRYTRNNSPADCNHNVTVTSTSAKLTSPNYPASYGSDLNCKWILTAARESNIKLTISEFSVEAFSNCSYDYLDIYSGSTTNDTLLRRLCGSVKDFNLVINSTSALLVFTTDSTFEEKGFEISHSLDGMQDESCNKRVIGSEGSVSSPGYPNSYGPSQDCVTLLQVPPGEIIYLNFKVLKLEFDDDCSYDYVAVYDGPSEDYPKLGQFCTNPASVSLKSSNNSLLLHFHSDAILNESGFQASYSTHGYVGESGSAGDCKWRQDKLEGSIWSPDYPDKYPSNTRCKIELVAPEFHYVSLTFEELQLEYDRNCSYDFIEVKDADNQLLGLYCGSYKPNPTVRSPSQRLVFSFNSDGFTEHKGFLVHYKFVEDVERRERDHLNAVANTHSKKFVSISPNATVLQGTRHAISCIPGSASDRIRWFKENTFLGGTSLPEGVKFVDSTTMEIVEMEARHVGRYTCTIAEPDPYRTPVNATIWLAMAFNEEDCDIILREVPYDVNITERIEYKPLKCSSPTPNVTLSWEKDGVPIVTSERIHMLLNGHLYMNKLLPTDQGFYSCVATNGDCKKRASAIVTIKRLQNIEEICGVPKQGLPTKEKPKLDSGRIVGGLTSQKGAHPWHAMLWEPNRKAFCGGVILNERWALSAAHCFEPRLTADINWKNVLLRLGKFDQAERETEEFSTQIEEVLIHPSYNVATFDNDMALIKLKETTKFSDYILPICLGESKTIEPDIFGRENRLGIVTGWGKIIENGASARQLKEIQLPIVKQATCQDSTKNLVTRNMFCAGYAQEIVGDACKGDSGGPFVVQNSGRWYLAGLVSWGEGCARMGQYGFYTKVTNYHSWIKGIVEYS